MYWFFKTSILLFTYINICMYTTIKFFFFPILYSCIINIKLTFNIHRWLSLKLSHLHVWVLQFLCNVVQVIPTKIITLWSKVKVFYMTNWNIQQNVDLYIIYTTRTSIHVYTLLYKHKKQGRNTGHLKKICHEISSSIEWLKIEAITKLFKTYFVEQFSYMS